MNLNISKMVYSFQSLETINLTFNRSIVKKMFFGTVDLMRNPGCQRFFFSFLTSVSTVYFILGISRKDLWSQRDIIVYKYCFCC